MFLRGCSLLFGPSLSSQAAKHPMTLIYSSRSTSLPTVSKMPFRRENHPLHTPWAPLFVNLGRCLFSFYQTWLVAGCQNRKQLKLIQHETLDWQFYLCFPFRDGLPVARINGWCQRENCGVLKHSRNFDDRNSASSAFQVLPPCGGPTK